jgi:hypothetical protein
LYSQNNVGLGTQLAQTLEYAQKADAVIAGEFAIGALFRLN